MEDLTCPGRKRLSGIMLKIRGAQYIQYTQYIEYVKYLGVNEPELPQYELGVRSLAYMDHLDLAVHVIAIRPVLMAADTPPLLLLGEHDDRVTLVFPHHTPEVTGCVR